LHLYCLQLCRESNVRLDFDASVYIKYKAFDCLQFGRRGNQKTLPIFKLLITVIILLLSQIVQELKLKCLGGFRCICKYKASHCLCWKEIKSENISAIRTKVILIVAADNMRRYVRWIWLMKLQAQPLCTLSVSSPRTEIGYINLIINPLWTACIYIWGPSISRECGIDRDVGVIF
jgi:hypothetical protein